MRRSSLILSLLIQIALAVTLLAPGPADAATARARHYQHHIVVATNHKRAAHGKHHLRVRPCLQKFARRQATREARQNRMFHQSLRKPLYRCHLALVGENVAMGYKTGWGVVRAWMHSPEHRANLLDKRFRKMGVAARRASNGRWYVSAVYGRGR